MLDKITPLILTYNEAPNIARNLSQLAWAKDIVLVDSHSTDETLQLASEFSNVRAFQRTFDTHQQQWSFGLTETGIKTPWVLALDADYILTDEFIAELKTLQPSNEVTGYRASFIYCYHGKRLGSGVYPPVTVLYRRDVASYEQDGHTQRVCVKGEVRNLHGPILHDDRKPLIHWLSSQARYAELESKKLLTAESATLSLTDRVRRWHVVAPPAMLFYCLFLRGGVFDGWAGFHYAFERTVAELMLSLHLIRNRLARPVRTGISEQSHELKVQDTKL
jgi:hypothetical protein